MRQNGEGSPNIRVALIVLTLGTLALTGATGIAAAASDAAITLSRPEKLLAGFAVIVANASVSRHIQRGGSKQRAPLTLSGGVRCQFPALRPVQDWPAE